MLTHLYRSVDTPVEQSLDPIRWSPVLEQAQNRASAVHKTPELIIKDSVDLPNISITKLPI